MTATNNLPTSQLIDSVIGNYQGSTRRIMIDQLAALLGDGGSGSGSSLAAEIADRIAADDAIRASKADLQNSGAFFTSRSAMAAVGQEALPGSKALALHPDGNYLVVRGFNASGDDPLFPTSPTWGVLMRVPAEEIISGIEASLDLKADLQNSGKFFTSRSAAVSAGQDALPGSLSIILTIEGDWVALRSFSNTTDDPLFTTQPSWGVARRVPAQPIIDAIQNDLANGRVFYVPGSTSPSGRDIPESADLVITNHNASNSYTIWRSVGPPPDGLETETMAKDISNRWWVFSIDRSVSDEATAKADAIRDSGMMPLANIGGTGDAITAELAPSMTAAGITSLSNNSVVEYIPTATNAAENPSITIAGTSFGIRNANGGTWPAGGFVVGRSYMLRRRNTLMRVVGGEVTSSELSSARAERVSAEAQIGSPTLVAVSGTGNAVTASVSASLQSAGITAANLRAVNLVWPADNAAGAVTLNIDGAGAVEVRTAGNAVPSASMLRGGRMVALVKSGTVWRMVSPEMTLSDLQTEITNRTTGDDLRTTAIRDSVVMPLANIGGTGDAITADLASSMTAAGITSLSTNSEVEYIPTATNAAENPTITIAGTSFGIRNANGGTWPAGGFVVGRSYMLRRRNTLMRVVGGEVTSSELSSARAERVSAEAQIGSPTLVAVSGTGNAVTASVPSSLQSAGITAANLRAVNLVWPADNAGGAVTLNIDGAGAAEVRTAGNAVPSASMLRGGRMVALVKSGTVWRMVSPEMTLSDLQTEITNRTTGDDLRTTAIRDSVVMPLANVGGTGDAITAELAPSMTAAGITSLSTNSEVEYIPTATNAAENPTITIAGTSFGIRNANGGTWPAGGFVVGRSYMLRRRNTLMRVVGGEVTSSELQAEAAARMGDTAAAMSMISEISAEVGGDHESIPNDGVEWFGWDRQSNAILGWSASGLRVHLDDWTVAEIGPRIMGDPALEVEQSSGETLDGRVLQTDAAGNALWMWRNGDNGGLDAIMSQAFWDRGRSALNLTAQDVSTTEWQAISVNGQSLSVGGDWAGSPITRDEFMARIDPAYALMLTGTVRGDNVPITTVDMPRSQGYNQSVPATGVAPADTSTQVVSAAAPLAYAVNAYRDDLGLPLVPIITQCHGISGIPIEDMDDDPATGTGETIVWNNLRFWYEQVVAQAASQGKVLTVPWHDWVHGTSAQSYAPGVYEAALWSYQKDFRALLSSLGAKGPAVFIMSQPGGNANTSGSTAYWHVCDEILNFCEAGGGVLATPEYAYQIADNNVHPNAWWTIQFEEVKARAIAEVEAGRPWTICRPRAKVNGNTVTLDFDSLRPGEYLVLHDPARYGGQGIDAYAGFEAIGATITGIEVRGRQVILACSAAPTGIRYAMQKQNVSGFPGNVWTAHRGLLRTSDVWPSKLLPGVDLYRWVPSFTMSL